MSKTHLYHEQQESQLCGQHCLNNLLQGPIFTAVDLAEIARELDVEERRLGAVPASSPYSPYNSSSANVDDSGNFSIQVLRVALQRFNHSDLVQWFQKKGEADVDVTKEKGIVVNRSNHWFTIRKINNRWWNLNSTIEKPEYISDFAVSAYLSSLRADGYSVFIAQGSIPDKGSPDHSSYLPKGSGVWYAEDDLYQSYQVKRPEQTAPGFQAFNGKGNKLGGQNNSQDGSNGEEYDEELELAKAISASLQPNTIDNSKTDDVRAKRLAALSRLGIK